METKELDKIFEEWQRADKSRSFFFLCSDGEDIHGQAGGAKEEIPLMIAAARQDDKVDRVVRRSNRIYDVHKLLGAIDEGNSTEKPVPLRGPNVNRVKRALEHIKSAMVSLRNMQGRDVTEECDERRDECLEELARTYNVIKKRLTDN